MNRRTKIVATLGPAVEGAGMVRRMVDAGLDVARLNFSHGDHAGHQLWIDRLRAAADDAGRTVGILQDLGGPKIRLGEVDGEGMLLEAGSKVVLVAGQKAASGLLAVNYPYLAEDVAVGDRLLMADGLVEIKVLEITGGQVCCRVLVGGAVSSHKGVNLPVSHLRVPAVTEKDLEDLAMGLAAGVDFVALSFVRHEDDLAPVRRMLNEVEDPPLLIAKIEKPQAVERLEQILPHVDAVMVARGDLGVEMPLEQVPLIQKRIIAQARRLGRPVITATQMLRSMMECPRPTRAEAADVANAILDGSDAVMLSDETAVGAYPVESVAMLERIALATEPAVDHKGMLKESGAHPLPLTEASISRAACSLADEVGAAAIVAATTSGSTARMVARFRPPQPVIGLTTNPAALRQMALTWGVFPALTTRYNTPEEMFVSAAAWARENGVARSGDRLVVTAGVPLGVPGTTNLVKVVQL